MQLPSSIPSPSHGVLHLGPLPLRGYALMIIAGIAVAVWLGDKRWVARGGKSGQVSEVAMWAVPFGVLGGRLYHVLTDWSAYFGTGGRGFLATFKIWEGGLGIWGAIALGGVGAYIGCSRQGIKLAPFADAIAPGIAFAQAIGRWGNWFNQELFGRPTSMPWGLEIDRANRPLDFINYPTFHPTFLYESIACLAIGFFLLWADRKFVFGFGRLFALYLATYCAARGVIETIRVDEANHILGIRLNVFTSIIVGIGALIFYVRSVERFPGQEIIEGGRVVGTRSDEEVRELRATTQSESQSADTETPDSASIEQSKLDKVQPTGPRRGRRVAPKE
jgi:prolipoprotein diacylglyceryl transferase